jgi:hypothetical protein
VQQRARRAASGGVHGRKVMVEGLRRAGPRPTREKLIAALESMRRLDLGGIDVTYGPQLRIGTVHRHHDHQPQRHVRPLTGQKKGRTSVRPCWML